MKLKLPAYRIWAGSDAAQCPHCGWLFSVVPSVPMLWCVFCRGPIQIQAGPKL